MSMHYYNILSFIQSFMIYKFLYVELLQTYYDILKIK